MFRLKKGWYLSELFWLRRESKFNLAKKQNENAFVPLSPWGHVWLRNLSFWYLRSFLYVGFILWQAVHRDGKIASCSSRPTLSSLIIPTERISLLMGWFWLANLGLRLTLNQSWLPRECNLFFAKTWVFGGIWGWYQPHLIHRSGEPKQGSSPEEKSGCCYHRGGRHNRRTFKRFSNPSYHDHLRLTNEKWLFFRNETLLKNF